MENVFQQPTSWSASKKIAFRFCFLYFFIYAFLNPNNEMPVVNLFYEWFNGLMQKFIPWFAKAILHISPDITVFTNGSGDTRYDYVLWLFGFLLAIVGCIIWTLVDKKRTQYQTLLYWLTVILRYYLFYTMVMYGLFKVIKLQFPFPTLNRLVQPYGDSSPMGLAWTYMGYSTTYNYFTGFAELLGGFLLLFRRTTTLGALVCFAVMTNVFMLNMGYDIPVKLLSFNTILMSLFLLRKDIKNLLNFFFLNKPTQPNNLNFPYTKKWIGYTAQTVKWLFVSFIIIANLVEAIQGQKEYGDKAIKPPFYGIYNVQSFVRNGDTILPLQTDTTRWKQLIVNYAGVASVKLTNDSIKRYSFEVDSLQKNVVVSKQMDTVNKYNLQIFKADSITYFLNGKLWGDSVSIKLKRFDENKFRLVNRGFHWVNEYPFNR